ncbi:MAG: F(420)H(2) dehydrogenase subunit H [Methanomassiliicoccales archaeon PtaU1.Bin124]|nr:MAG: F(420)H(2) dehydrogenase subunit H [Methanomassiliicoccales archaeon PtaU1.Bin124]
MELIISIFLWALIPLIVGVMLGLDRIVTARMQGRKGPSVLQSIRDLLKLLGKKGSMVNRSQVAFVYLALALQAIAAFILIIGSDILTAFLLSGAGSFMMVVAALSVRSPYSHLGAHRELVQIMATEPVVMLVVLSMGYASGSFISSNLEGALVLTLPLAVIAMVPTLLIRLEKSPFDIATAHSEIVSGPYVELSGRTLGISKLAHWYELVVMFGIFLLFFSMSDPILDVVVKVIVLVTVVFAIALIDNSTARLTRWRMLRFSLTYCLGAVMLNLVILYLINGGVF